MAIINQHPEWEAVASWFADRAKAAGCSIYEHVEHVSVESAISQQITDTATELAYTSGLSIRTIIKGTL